MEVIVILFLVAYAAAATRNFCGKVKIPLEVGKWNYSMYHMDSATVENSPVSINEGQVYVYENYFPGYTIKYIHVDNLAIKTCGASATIKSGGVGTSSVLIVLHAGANQEMRSIVDIWGSKNTQARTRPPIDDLINKLNIKSMYLFKSRAFNHNKGSTPNYNVDNMFNKRRSTKSTPLRNRYLKW